MGNTSYRKTIASAAAITLLASGCGLLGASEEVIGAYADQYDSGADIDDIPAHFYLPISADFPQSYAASNNPENVGIWSDDDDGVALCGLESDTHRSMFWFDLNDGGGLFDLGHFSFHVHRLESIEDAEVEFDRQIEVLNECNTLPEAIDTAEGTLSTDPTPVSDLGDEAARSDATVWFGIIGGEGDLVLVRKGNTVIVGSHVFSSTGAMDRERFPEDEFPDGGSEAILELLPGDAAEEAMRSVLARIDDLKPSGLTVREVHPDFIVVENTGDLPLLDVTPVSLVDAYDEFVFQFLASSPLPPGEKTVFRFDTSTAFTVLGIEADVPTYDLAVEGELTIDGPASIIATGPVQTLEAPVGPTAQFVFRDADGVVVNTQRGSFPEERSYDEESGVGVRAGIAEFFDLPDEAVTVELMRR